MATNQPLTVRVVREFAGGLIVALPDGREGVIRERELSWDPEERREGTRRFKPGERLDAVLLGKGSPNRPELSLRLAQADPWAKIEKRYPAGSLAEGVVTGIMPYGAFVELELGVTGLLHRSRLPQWAAGEPADLFWPGDLVKVLIEKVETRTQRISLSMEGLLSQRWRNAPHEATPGSAPARPRAEEPLRSRLDVLFARPPSSLLVVEDDPTQQAAIVDWLRRAGQGAEAASDVDEALKRMETLRPDIVLMDVDLPALNGVDGLRRIMARWPETRGVLMTDWSQAAHYARDIQELRQTGVSLLIKPLLPEDLLGILLAEGASGASGEQSELPIAPTVLPQPQTRLTGARKDELAGTLLRLLRATRAGKVVIFEVDTDSRQVQVFDQKGPATLNPSAVADLIHSPVRDAAEDGRMVVARNDQEAEGGRFRYLTPLISFKQCLGVPVPARLHKRYALFLFFQHPEGWPESHLDRVEGAAEAIGSWLERQQFIRQIAGLHRMAVLGQMKRTLSHEVSSRLAVINLGLDALEYSLYCIQFNATSSPQLVAEEAATAQEKIKALRQPAQMIARTTRSLSRMTQARQEEIVVLEQLISESLVMLDDLAETGHVKVEVAPFQRVTFTRTNVTYLQQVLVNVLKNAIQHIQQLRPEQGGRVSIRLGSVEESGKPLLQLRVEDDGPGIHRRNWEHIFDLDFTTRPEGSGLGLYLSRSLIESQGGRLCVESSHMLWGTTFLIELPLHT